MTPRFSIITPVFEPPAEVLRATIQSMLDQTFTDWELILVDDASPSPHVGAILAEFAAADDRIIVIRREANGGIVAASNDGLAAASGEFVGLLDHDDTLVAEALRLVDMYAERFPEMDYCYSDEDLLAPDGTYFGPFYKPEWSPERLRAQNYCTHLSVFRASLLDEIGGFRAGFDGSQDYDIILRATERAREIVHIPFVLYHWRQIVTSVAMGDPTVKPYAYEAGRRAVDEHCARVGVAAEVTQGGYPGNYHVRRRVTEASTSVVVVTRGESATVWGIERCHVVEAIRSVAEATSRPVEFVVVAAPGTPASVEAAVGRAAGSHRVRVIDADVALGADTHAADGGANANELVNLGALAAVGDHLLLMHDDVEVITAEFLDELLGIVADESVGAVGCKSYFSDGRLRHGGYVHNGNPHEIMQGFAADEPGHRGMLTVPREVGSVSGACLMIRRDLFLDVGGFSRQLQRDFGDVDLGLKLRSRQLTRVWTPHVEVYDFGPIVDPCAPTPDRRALERRWGHQLHEDPYFNPNLQPDRNDWVEKGLR